MAKFNLALHHRGTMLRIGRTKRFISTDVKRQLYADCLNLKFANVLKVVKETPLDDVDYSFLQLYLAKSCQWGHMESISHIWYRFVMRNNAMTISPHLLCDIGNLALSTGNYFIPEQVYIHFTKYYENDRRYYGYDHIKYELIRIKVEGFAKGTGKSTEFREKWKIFLQDMDNILSKDLQYRVRDFPNLTKSLTGTVRSTLISLLFSEGKIAVTNPTSLPMLLNMILLQPESDYDIDFKLNIFEKFYSTHKSLSFVDSIKIISRCCRNDNYRFKKLNEFLMENNLIS